MIRCRGLVGRLLVLSLAAVLLAGLLPPGAASGAAGSIGLRQTNPPAKPANIEVVGHSTAWATVSWDDPKDDTITKYQFRRRPEHQNWWYPDWIDIPSTGATTTWLHTITPLINVFWIIQVRAVRSGTVGMAAEVRVWSCCYPREKPSPTPTPPTPPASSSGGGASAGLPPAEEPEDYFVDDEGSVHEAAIDAVAAAGITAGCATDPPRYCGDQPVSRAEMATFLTRALDLPAAQPAGFTDIAPGSTHAAAIDAVAAAGITAGCATDPPRYCGDQPVTRAEMATFLTRALDLPAAQPAGFTDVDPDGIHAAAIDAVAAAGITAGCGTDPLRYCGDQPVTRAEMATFLARALDLPIP